MQLCTKYCKKCKETKPITEFNKNKQFRDGHNYICWICQIDGKLQREYGISFAERQQMLEAQNYKYPICTHKIELPKRGNHRNSTVVGNHYAVVDHCHETGVTRGLLCGSCNVMLGKAQDRTDWLENAINYLKKDD